jgi:hypothetical protein
VFGKELPPQPPADQVISPGDGVETKVSVGGEEFRAKRLGTVEMNNGIISVLSLVSVSEDALAATMPLCGRTAGSQGMPVETRHVLQSLREAGIFFGVKEDYIQQHLVKAQMNDADDAETVLDCAEIVVAEGKPKVDGTEARLEIDKQITSGKLREDGRIDFRERSYPWNVAKGTVVGRIIPALRAVDGMTVYGKVIPARPAKDVDITLVGVEHRIDGQLVAISGGVLTVSKTTLSVAEALTIEGDVGIRTGHVKAATTVSVKGHVEPGSIVAAKGDIIIRENVEEAIIYASGNVVVYGGVRGRRAKIYADGQVNVSFIEGGEIYAKSDIEVSSAAIDARLESTGNIIIGPKPGLLINSHCESLGEVRVVSIGKLSSEASTVCLGVSADKQQRHKDLEEQEELTTKERFEKNWLDYYLQEAGQVPGRQALRIRSHINSDVKLSIWSKTTKIQGGNAARDYYIDPDEKKITHRPYDEKSDIPEVKRSTDETVPPDEAVAAAPAPAASDDAANEDQG